MISREEVIAFVYREARLLDEQRFDEWLELFTEDGCYWMPLEHGQTDRRLTASLMDEDVLLLRIRVERLKGIRTYSQKPKSRCHHLLQQPQVDVFDPDASRYSVWTAMHYVETRQERQELYAAWATHDLTDVDGALRIRMKRVDLVNCDAAFGSIQLFL
ncbi:MAG TPA: aromatic-ring-hydroxylating dioxygenase subunit beta [Rhodopila sp.]